MKKFKSLAALVFATLALGSCQTRDMGPTQPACDNEVELAARLVATKAPPGANRVRLRLNVGGIPGQWIDSAYVSGREILLGRVPRGTEVTLDVRAYSLGASIRDTLWKWFARAAQKADSALAIQVLDARIDTVPTSLGLRSTATSSNAYALPAGSRYTLDGSDPKSGAIADGSDIVVPKGKTLRAIVRIVVPGFPADTLVGDTLHVVVQDFGIGNPDPVVPLKAPSITSGGYALPRELAVGASIFLQADSTAKLAYTTDGGDPDCRNASEASATISIEPARAGSMLVIRALSCRDPIASSETKDSVRIANLDETIKEQIRIPAAYQWDNPDATILWTENVLLAISPRSALVWNLRVVPAATTAGTADWTAVGIPDTVAKTGAGTVIRIPKEMLSSLSADDSVANVLAVAVLYDSTKAAVDTARLRWSIVVPVTPKPSLSVARFPGKLVFSWPVTASTADARVWYMVGGDTVNVSSFEKGDATDSFRVVVPDGERVKVGVTSISGATGRASELAILDTVALQHSRKPGYAIANIDTVEGKVEIVLDAATLAEKNTTWKAGYASDSSTAVAEYPFAFDSAGKCIVTVNTGTRDFGVRATRDGMVADSVTRLVVKRTKGVSPGQVRGLKVSRSDSSTVVWSWDRSSPMREYRVFVLRGVGFESATDTSKCEAVDMKSLGTLDSFEVTGLANGATVSLAVVALAGSDSAAGNAEPVFATTTTLAPPPIPRFTVVNTKPEMGEVMVAIENFGAGPAWSVGFDSTGGVEFVESRVSDNAVTKSFAVNGVVNVQVKAVRDGYAKTSMQSLQVKNTDLVAPDPPSGISWMRATDSVVLSWTTLADHEYRLFYDISPSAADIDTAAATTNRVANPTSPYTIRASSGQRVRIALQTASAKDSTRPSAPVLAYQTTMATIDPVETIVPRLTNAATRTVAFTWTTVDGAVKYMYSSSIAPGVVNDTTLNALSFACPSGTSDISLSIQAVNADGVVSSPTISTFHIPQNRGSTNLADWNVSTKGTTLTIQGLLGTAITGTAPDSAIIRLYARYGESETWRISYSELGTFMRNVNLYATAMNAGEYEVLAQFRWTSGALRGDTTDIDARPVRGWAGPSPQAIYQIEDGKMKVGILDGGLSAASRPGWNIRVFANYDGSWVDIVDNPDQVTYPDITDAGYGFYPLGATQLKVYSDSGSNASVERVVPILPEDSLVYEGHVYPIVLFGAKRWITRPMNTPTTANLCADQTTSSDCGNWGRLYTWLEATKLSAIPDQGDNLVQGVCPTGWRIPYSSEFVDLANAVEPGWKWIAPESGPFPETYSKLLKAGFDFRGYTKDHPSNGWGSPAMWSATTGTGGNLQYKDLWFIHNWSGQGDIFSAIARAPTSQQIAMTFCIEQ